MQSSLRRLAIVFGLSGALLAPAAARAQMLAPIRYNEGPGVKLSESLEFHPGIALEGRYDSNVFLTSSRNNQQVIGAPYLRVIGHLHLTTTSPQRLEDTSGKRAHRKVAFRLKGALAYREYFPVTDTYSTQVKDRRSLEVDAGMNLELFPDGFFTARIFDDYVRSNPQWAGMNPNAPRNSNRGGLAFRLSPGGRRITLELGYSINLDMFDDALYASSNKYYHEVNFSAKWRLLPKTAVFLQASEQFISYYDTSPPAGNHLLVNSDSKPLRIYLGGSSLFTPRFSMMGRIGYGNGFYDEGDSYSMLLGSLELRFHIGPTAKIKGGFEHLFSDSLYGNYFTDELAYVGYDHLVINRILLHLKGEYRWRSYSGLPAGSGINELKNHLVQLNVAADYKIRSWVYVGLGYDLGLRYLASDYLPSLQGGVYVNDFVKHQVYAKVGVSY